MSQCQHQGSRPELCRAATLKEEALPAKMRTREGIQMVELLFRRGCSVALFSLTVLEVRWTIGCKRGGLFEDEFGEMKGMIL